MFVVVCLLARWSRAVCGLSIVVCCLHVCVARYWSCIAVCCVLGLFGR